MAVVVCAGDSGSAGHRAHPFDNQSIDTEVSAAAIKRPAAGFSIAWEDFAEGDHLRTDFSSGYIFRGDSVVEKNGFRTTADWVGAEDENRRGFYPWLKRGEDWFTSDLNLFTSEAIFPLWGQDSSLSAGSPALAGALSYPLLPDFWVSVRGNYGEDSGDRTMLLPAVGSWRRFVNGVHLSYDPSRDRRHLLSAGLAWESVAWASSPLLIGTTGWSRAVREQAMRASFSWHWYLAQGVTFRPEVIYRFSRHLQGAPLGTISYRKRSEDTFAIGATVSARF